MTDITKCANSKHCDRARDCHRHTAPSNKYRQSWAPFYAEGAVCGHFWANEGFRKGTNDIGVRSEQIISYPIGEIKND